MNNAFKSCSANIFDMSSGVGGGFLLIKFGFITVGHALWFFLLMVKYADVLCVFFLLYHSNREQQTFMCSTSIVKYNSITLKHI